MIARNSGIRVTVAFGDFAMVPPAAWKGIRASILSAFHMYGIDGVVVDDGKAEDAHQRWWSYVREQQEKDAEAGREQT
jgi:hypothetical protein